VLQFVKQDNRTPSHPAVIARSHSDEAIFVNAVRKIRWRLPRPCETSQWRRVWDWRGM